MFGLFGIAEAIALAVIGGISAPLFVRPSRRSGPLLVARRFNVGADAGAGPAVSIEGRQSGLLTLFGGDKSTTLEVNDELITFHRGGFWHEQHETIPLSQVASVRCVAMQPVWHLSAIGLIAAVMILAEAAGRLTLQQFGAGVVAAAVCGIVSALQRTIELVIETAGKTRLALTFTAISPRHALSVQDVALAAERITELVILRGRYAV